jgi:hypothetical protein
MEHLNAPFDTSACDRLNQFQVGVNSGFHGHPFTCSNRSDGRHGEEGGDLGVLIAIEEGWVCPHCNYTQQWAHAVMAAESTAGLPDWLEQARLQQLPELLSKLISAYESLELKTPGSKGVAQMLVSLNKRATELKLSSR